MINAWTDPNIILSLYNDSHTIGIGRLRTENLMRKNIDFVTDIQNGVFEDNQILIVNRNLWRNICFEIMISI